MAGERFPELSAGARELLRIAIENDKHQAIANNAALLEALDWLGRLPLACRSRSGMALRTLLGLRTVPETFLVIAGAALEQIRRRVDERFKGQVHSADTTPVVTDFNRHLLQAMAETLADAAWPARAADDFDGPGADEVRSRLAECRVYELHRSLLRNYLGNILQDLFAAARIREAVRGLPPDTELKLRSQDGASLAAWVMERVSSTAGQPLETTEVARCLETALRLSIQDESPS